MSNSLKFVTVGAIMSFVMPYTTMVVLALLLWLEARGSVFSSDSIRTFVLETALLGRLPEWLTDKLGLSTKMSTVADSPQTHFQHVPLYVTKNGSRYEPLA